MQKRSHGTCGKGRPDQTEELENIYNECLEKLGGRVDILLNGAGIQFRLRLLIFPHDRWEKIIALNMNAVFYMSQLAAKQCWCKNMVR